MTKHNGKYYLQYASPGTEWKSYADGIYVADSLMGPFEYVANNPVSYKPTGFIGGQAWLFVYGRRELLESLSPFLLGLMDIQRLI